jgi:hypothetical protein
MSTGSTTSPGSHSKSLRYFDSVVIACNHEFFDIAVALRAMLECFNLRVHLYYCVQKRQLLDALTGNVPASKYFVLLCHGGGDENVPIESPEDLVLFLKVIDEIPGRTGEWEECELRLTPENIPQLVKLEEHTLITVACGSGREPLVKAFLQAGCAAYIAPIKPLDDTAALQFVNAFFYHLLVSERDPALSCTEEEAVKRAAALDIDFQEGTRLFRYFANTPVI